MYTYEHLKKEIHAMWKKHPHAEIFSIGQSVEGRSLYTVRVGQGPIKVFFCGAHHGSEWITSILLMRFLKEELMARKLNPDLSVFITPMVNPDGVELSQKGVCNYHPWRREMVRWNGGEDFTHWQANARGVDLNHNYRAGFYAAKEMEKAAGIFGPSPTRYGGEEPESEPEVRAVADLTRGEQFSLSIAFHSQGEVIYWDYMGKESPKAEYIAKRLSEVSTYELSKPEGIASYGGYKDWVIDTFGTPSFTVEVGHGENPLPEEQIEEITEKNFPLLWEALSLAAKMPSLDKPYEKR